MDCKLCRHDESLPLTHQLEHANREGSIEVRSTRTSIRQWGNIKKILGQLIFW